MKKQDEIDEQIEKGRWSQINYHYSLRLWFMYTLATAGTVFVANVIYLPEHQNLYLQLILAVSNFFCLWLLYVASPAKSTTLRLQKEVFDYLIFESNQRLEEFIQNFFVYKKMRGLLSQAEIQVVGKRYSELLKAYIPEPGEWASDAQSHALKEIPKLKKFLAWYSDNISKESILPFSPQFFHAK
jgi:hypothetical protein